MEQIFTQSKISTTGTGETTTTIPVGVGMFELVAASVVGASGIPNAGRLIYGWKDGNTNKYTHLQSGWATANIPLCLNSPRKLEGPGGIVAIMYHEASEAHTLSVTLRRPI